MINYWITVYKDKESGLFCAKKVYKTYSGAEYMWGYSAEEVKYKLVQDGEEEEKIRIFDQNKVINTDLE